jgi:hypothetical protein
MVTKYETWVLYGLHTQYDCGYGRSGPPYIYILRNVRIVPHARMFGPVVVYLTMSYCRSYSTLASF